MCVSMRVCPWRIWLGRVTKRKQNKKQLNGTKLNGVESLPWTTDYAMPTQRRAYVGPGTIRYSAATWRQGARAAVTSNHKVLSLWNIYHAMLVFFY